MIQNFLDDQRIFDACDDLDRTATSIADRDIDISLKRQRRMMTLRAQIANL